MPGLVSGKQRTQLTGAHSLIEETATLSASAMRKVCIGRPSGSLALEVGEGFWKGFPHWGEKDDEAMLTGQMEKQSISGKEKGKMQRCQVLIWHAAFRPPKSKASWYLCAGEARDETREIN